MSPTATGRPCQGGLKEQKPCPSTPCYIWDKPSWSPCQLQVEVRRSGGQEVRRSGGQEIRRSGGQDVRRSGGHKVIRSECKEVRRSGCQEVMRSECKEVRRSGCQDVELVKNVTYSQV